MTEPRPGHNRRLARRLTPRRTTKVICPKGRWGLGPNVALAVLDVSESGARVRLKEALSVGHEVDLSLESVQLARPYRVSAVVVWSVPSDDGTHCVGLRFEKPLPFAVFQAVAGAGPG